MADRAAADAAYVYGIPALVVVGLLVLAALVWLLPPLTRALLSVAEAGRLVGGVVAMSGKAAEERAEARHRELMAAVGDVKATVAKL